MKSVRVALVLAALAAASSARADAAADSARARSLFFEARGLMGEGHYDEACPKLEESERLDPGIGTEYNLADCYEHVGKLARALTLFERVVGTSHDAGQDRHEAQARKRAATLAARVPLIVIEVPDDARVQGLEITRDGEPIAVAASTQIRLDAGHHVIAATAPGRTRWETPVDLADGDRTTVRVPSLALLPVEPTPITPPPAPTVSAAPPPRVLPPPRDEGRTQRTIGLVVGGAGIASILVGGVFGTLAIVAHDDAKQWCSGTTNGCTSPVGVDARSSAVSRGNVSTALFVAGGALLGAGFFVWWLAPSSSAVQVGLSPFGVAARGTY